MIQELKSINHQIRSLPSKDAKPFSINETTSIIKNMISKEMANAVNDATKKKISESHLLDHLHDQTEEPFKLIESYFEGKYLERLVRHQIESYNHFINYQIQRTIKMFNPVKIHSENDYIEEKDKYFLEINVSFINFKLYPPQIHENNGATKTMMPQESKLRNFTYASNMTIDIQIDYIIRNTESMDQPKVIRKTPYEFHLHK